MVALLVMPLAVYVEVSLVNVVTEECLSDCLDGAMKPRSVIEIADSLKGWGERVVHSPLG